jgi:hypothetical protein
MELAAFLAKWSPSGGAERANKDSFVRDLCDLLGVPHPDPTSGDPARDAYVFERSVTFHHPDATETTGKIDLYKRGCFVLEAKQGSDARHAKVGAARRGTAAWMNEMDKAYAQARNYVHSLPVGEAPPTFLVTCDLGFCFELYAQFDGSDQYRPFPNAPNKRIHLEELEKRPELLDVLRAVWTDPKSLDPSKRSAKVTREIAADLALLAADLEKAGHAPQSVATFLMRCIFTMFAEDVGLLPERLFTDALEKYWIPNPAGFPVLIESLWKAMNDGGSFGFVGQLLKFNGGLFANPTSLPLKKPDLEKLHRAASHNWADVEPAIFGTLLERALSPKERHKLGAHYTPRAYVERLVKPTIEEPLRAEWDIVRAQVRTLIESGKKKDATEAIGAVHAFQHKLATTRVLDPACGSGNFLYVTLDLFKRLEGEVLALLHDLGETQELLETERVTPAQFLGIEIKPWAKEIAELVLWIGYLQWHFRTHGKGRPPPLPVLQDYKNIECRDAVLAWDSIELEVDEHGKPRTRWDGETYKKSAVTGEDVPDETARVAVYRYVNPRKAEWPRADFVVGNPPFIGGWRMRQMLGDGYVTAIWATYPTVPEKSDFVTYWWKRAADAVLKSTIQRFGLITTNSITQVYQRRVLQEFLDGSNDARIVFAIADHPWVDERDAAAVRVAMTVGASRSDAAWCGTVVEDRGVENVAVSLQRVFRLNADLSSGVDLDRARALLANGRISSPGVQLYGAGFILEDFLVESMRSHGAAVIRKYMNGRDLARSSRGVHVIDFFGMSEEEAAKANAHAYQHVLDRVRPERAQNRRVSIRDVWWRFGWERPVWRAACAGLRRFVTTPETAKHRVFVFLDAEILPDNMLTNIAVDDAFFLGVMSSRAHVVWALAAGGTLEDRPRYTKTRCFDPFPFPTDLQRARIRALGESLDAHRKRQQALHADLTITGMYNVLEKLRSGEPLTDKERAIHEKGLVSILKQIHDELDAAVFDAYGWPRDLTDEQILERLVALNAERAEEERNGLVRWLRPEFQNPAGTKEATQATIGGTEDVEETTDEGPKIAVAAAWPKKLPERIAAVRDLVLGGKGAWSLEQAVAAFAGAKKGDVETALESLSALGIVVAYGEEKARRYRAAGRVAA